MLTSAKTLQGFNGIAKIPGDKSISHRSVIIPSIANGITEVYNILKSEDVLKTINAVKSMGIKIEEKNNVLIYFVGYGGSGPPQAENFAVSERYEGIFHCKNKRILGNPYNL